MRIRKDGAGAAGGWNCEPLSGGREVAWELPAGYAGTLT